MDRLATKLDAAAPYGLLVRFAALTGLRAGEIIGLRVRDVNIAAGHVEVRQTLQRLEGRLVAGTPKSARSTRVVPLMDRRLIAGLRAHLLAHPRSGDPDALFWPAQSVGSHALDWDGVLGSFRRNYFRPALRELGMADMRPHDLRHTAASLWLAAGFSVVEVSRWLGHGSITTTDTIYAHLYPTDYAATVARFEAFAARGWARLATSGGAATITL